MLRYFPEMDIYWLLTGKKTPGVLPSTNDPNEEQDEIVSSDADNTSIEKEAKELVAVLCLYKDGSFEKFNSST